MRRLLQDGEARQVRPQLEVRLCGRLPPEDELADGKPDEMREEASTERSGPPWKGERGSVYKNAFFAADAKRKFAVTN